MARSFRALRSVACVFALLAGCGEADPGPGAPVLGTAVQALKTPGEALIELQKSLDASVPGILKQLSPKDQADLVNGLAWYDDDPRTLKAARGVRGQVTHASSRFLAYDVAPGLPAAPSTERAKAAIDPGGIVRALSNVSSGDTLQIARSYERPDQGRRFVVEQRLSGTRVYRAGATFDLDASGRLTRFDGTFVPSPKPASGSLIGSGTALPFAEQFVLALGEPWTLGKIVAIETEAVIVHRIEFDGPDDARHAWRFLLAVPGQPSALREVLIDRITKGVIGSVDQVRYLEDIDHVRRASGAIGGGAALGEFLWVGTESCPGPETAISGATPFDRDFDEVRAALCEAERVFQAFGPELGVPDPREWMDPSGLGVRIGIGATPLLSVAMNSGGTLVFAEGVGRAEIVGHEIFHSTARAFSLSGGHEAAAVEEHLADAFGLLLERRFSLRRENDCLLNDDPDSMATIASQDLSTLPPSLPFRPCADLGLARPWRNACAPTTDNGGWCEGADSYRDMAFNKYDAYGDTSSRPSTHIASHTNLGIGNRLVMSLLGEVPTASPHRVADIGDTDVTRLVLGTISELGASTDWSAYAEAMVRVARTISGGGVISPVEREVRNAISNADIWSLPAPILPRMSPSAPPTMPVPPASTRPAVATVSLAGDDDDAGRERTFVFYRPSASSTAIEYVWRDDVDGGGGTSELSDGWTGPCTLPGAVTQGSPAAAGSDQSLFVAWGEPTGTPGESSLRGLRMTGEAAAEVESGCGFDWENNDPIAERTLEGSPAIAVWGASEYLTLCEVLKQDFPGISLPFRSSAAMGIYIPDCVDVAERIPGMPHDFWPDIGIYLFDILKGVIDGPPSLGLPQPGDPWAPRLPDFDPEFGMRIDLVSQLAGNKNAEAAFRQIPGPLGKRFGEAFDRYGSPRARGIEAVIQQKAGFGESGFPEGTVESVDLRFFDDILVVAFKDTDGKLRSTTWTDIAPTSDIALLHEAPTTDPSLTQARTLTVDDHGHRLEANFLYAVYGTSEVVDGTARPRLSYRVATSFEPDLGGLRDESFSDERRMDTTVDTVGVRRKRDYRFIQTNQTPVAAGGNRALHVLTVARRSTGEQPDDTAVGDVPATSDRIKHTVFEVRWDGKLAPLSERPVTLSRSRLTTSVAAGQAGAAIATTGRRRVRWFYPNGGGLDVRSEGEM